MSRSDDPHGFKAVAFIGMLAVLVLNAALWVGALALMFAAYKWLMHAAGL